MPLEQALNGVPGLDVIRSKSVPQLSSIVLIFKPGTDLMRRGSSCRSGWPTVDADPARPGRAPPVMLQPLSSTSRVMKIGLSSDDDLADRPVDDRVLEDPGPAAAGPGVANVAIWGERLSRCQVQVDPERLQRARRHARRGHGGRPPTRSTPGSCGSRRRGRSARAASSTRRTSGSSSSTCCRSSRRRTWPRSSSTERGGEPLRLGDVADVVQDHQPLIGDAVINDGPGLMLIVEKLPWGNTLDVTAGVEEALDELRPGLPGVEIDTTIFRPGDLHRDRDRQPDRRRCCSACCSWCWCSALFLFDWRTALISVVAIPLSLVAAGLVLYCAGRHDQHDGAGGVGDRGRGRSSTTPSSTSRTSSAGCARHAPARASDRSRRRRSSSTRRSRSAARSSTPR